MKIIPFLFLLISCTQPTDTNQGDMETWKSEIMEVEKNFNDMVLKEGIAKAFAAYAAENAAIKRNGKLVMGTTAIYEWYEENSRPNGTLTWKPDFIDVSGSGDLAYTYGKTTFSSQDSTGTVNTSTGIFHTVWKRQSDGQWKFVWD